jgi:hypothetical protein
LNFLLDKSTSYIVVSKILLMWAFTCK